MLTQAREQLEREGIRLWLAGLNPGVKAMVRRSELGHRLGEAGLRPPSPWPSIVSRQSRAARRQPPLSHDSRSAMTATQP
ncbi:hypothetical protein [Synechococcus sp. GFB01]|uniref:hypothetical protein n=1 Tax=Synechococcus sp. GFB01 TaxID=1662190 RepID=UPI00069F1C81